MEDAKLLDEYIQRKLTKHKEELLFEIKSMFEEYSQSKESSEQEDELLTIKETCKMLQVTAPTLSAWCEKSILTRVRFSGRVYFSKKEINKVIKSQIKL